MIQSTTDGESVDAIQEKTRAVIKVLAAESKRTQYCHIKGYLFGICPCSCTYDVREVRPFSSFGANRQGNLYEHSVVRGMYEDSPICCP